MLDSCGVYLINLDQSQDRLKTMTEGFDALDVPFNRVPSVYGPTAKVPDGVRCSPHFTPGELGCVLSHRRCYEEILKSDKPWGMVFEDDVLLDTEGWRLLEKAFSERPENCELLKFQGQTVKPRKMGLRIQMSSLDAERAINFRIQNPLCAAGYFVSKAGCRKLLSFLDVLETADVIIEHSWKYGVVTYNVEPQIFGWSDFHSKSVISSLGRNDFGPGSLWGRRYLPLHAWYQRGLYSLKAVGLRSTLLLAGRYIRVIFHT